MNADQVAQILGVHRNTVANWYETAAFSGAQLAQLGDYAFDVDYILFGTRSQPYALGEERPKYEALPDGVSISDYIFVPYYDVPVSGGHGAAALERPPKAFNAYRKDYLEKRGLLGKPLAEFPVRGDSNWPELTDGDTVLVDRSALDITGDMYVFRQDDDLLVKFLQRLPGGDVQVTSRNAEAYPPYTIRASDFEAGTTAVVGRVVRQGRDR